MTAKVAAQWYASSGEMFAEIVKYNAPRSARQRSEPEVVHNHHSTQPCQGGCVIIWPSGDTEPLQFAPETTPILGPGLTAAFAANQRHPTRRVRGDHPN